MFAASSIVSPPQLMLLAGMILLGWVLVRRQVSSRRRGNQAANRAPAVAERETLHRSLPLSDAPVETQRWQVAMFDLQRELKADLDTRIAVVQSLLRQVDQRIEHLETLASQQKSL